MKVAVKLIGWHPRWQKIESVKAIREATGCGLGAAKMMVDDTLNGEQPACEVEGLAEARQLARKLAELGAISSCVGEIYDCYEGEEREAPYRLKAVARMMVSESAFPEFRGKLLSGEVPNEFDLSLPINGSLDFRVAGVVTKREGGEIWLRLFCEDADEEIMWRDLLRDEEVDVHVRG